MLIDEEKDVVVGNSRTYCAICVRKICAKENKPYATMVDKDRNKHIGERLKKLPWKDAAGEPVLVCHSCLKEMADETI